MSRNKNGRVYARPESANLWIEFTAPDGSKVRRSARTQNRQEAEAELTRQIALSKSLTFQAAVVDFFEVNDRPGGLRKKTLENYRVSLRAVAPFLQDLCLLEIDAEVLKSFVQQRRRAVSDTTVKRDLAFVSTVFSHAVETMPGGPSVNPVLSFSKKKLREQARTRWLRPAEYERLRQSCYSDLQRLVIETAVLTGMRHSELTGLRQHMINFSRREVVLHVDLTKSKRERVIPLSEQLCVQLEELCAQHDDDLVFHYIHPRTRRRMPYTTFARWWPGVRSRAHLDDVRFHDLRHTFASWWVQAGGSLMTLRDLLGHSSMHMVERYAHLNTAGFHDEIREVFDAQFPHRERKNDAHPAVSL